MRAKRCLVPVNTTWDSIFNPKPARQVKWMSRQWYRVRLPRKSFVLFLSSSKPNENGANGTSRPSSIWTYTLTMRQQPLAARACGFGERDRRVIDPPPILELKIDHPTATEEEKRARLKDPYYVVHCSLWSADHDVDNSAMDDTTNGARGSGSGQRRLMGTLVSSPFVGKDENGVEGCFFCFPDLSCQIGRASCRERVF